MTCRLVGVVDPGTGQIIGTPSAMRKIHPLVNTVIGFD